MPPMRPYRLQLQCLVVSLSTTIIIKPPRPHVTLRGTYRHNFLLIHATLHIRFVCKHQQAGAPQTLSPRQHNHYLSSQQYAPTSYVPLLAANPSARPDSPRLVTGPWRPRPISGRPSSQSSSSSTTGASFALQRPLRGRSANPVNHHLISEPHAQILSLYLVHSKISIESARPEL